MGLKSKPIRRSGPRFTVTIDFNLQYLTPTVHGKDGMYYFHLGWLSGFVGIGRARDTFYDALDRGCGIPKR